MNLFIRLMVMVSFFSFGSLYAEPVASPDMEFLEYLGEWNTGEDQWQDPMDMLLLEDSDFDQTSDEQTAEETDDEE